MTPAHLSPGKKGWIAGLREHLRRVVQLHDTPHSIAGGVALGVFFGFTPFLGVKTLLGILVAWVVRCSRVAAAVGVALHDVIIPLMPVLLRLEYEIGFWLLNHPHRWPQHLLVDHLHVQQWLHWDVFTTVIWPTFLGSLVIGGPVSLAVFFVTLRIVARAQARRRAADAAALDLDIDDFE
ncbi:MAG: DUF2062 domain-containing protein [Chthoniobacteraceae bacterium]|nr:DUF2062 domain-containing protein [Chthoniobacteraceae bacterium]